MANSLWVCTKFNYNSGGRVYFSSNGGNTWVKRNPMISDSLNQVNYIDIKINSDGEGFITGYLQHPGLSENIPLIFRTTDSGESWEPLTVNNFNPSVTVSKNNLEWIIFGTIPDNMNPKGAMLKTTDAGNTWTRREIFGSYVWAKTAEYIPENQSLIVNTGASIFSSADFGETFKRLTTDQEIFAKNFAIDKKDISPMQLVVAVSNGDSLIVSRDGGYTWNKKFIPAELGQLTNSVAAADGNIFIITTSEALYKSADFGITWKKIRNASNFSALAAYDSNHIVTGLSYPTSFISYTSNGGNLWFDIPVNFSRVMDIQMISPSEFYTCGISHDSGYGGFIFSTKEGGRNWKVIDTKYVVNIIKTAGPDNVFALSDFEMFESRNAGWSWRISKSVKFEYFYDNLAFIDSLNGIIKIAHKLYKTTNAGLSWPQANFSTPYHSRTMKMEFNNRGDLLALNESGRFVLFPADQIVFSRRETIGTVYGYELYQNYPNPFNPSTTISYSIPVPGKVSIKIFDVLGREIETLINEVKPPGKYEITWNSSGLPSGVYFYQMSAGEVRETKKMILIK